MASTSQQQVVPLEDSEDQQVLFPPDVAIGSEPSLAVLEADHSEQTHFVFACSPSGHTAVSRQTCSIVILSVTYRVLLLPSVHLSGAVAIPFADANLSAVRRLSIASTTQDRAYVRTAKRYSWWSFVVVSLLPGRAPVRAGDSLQCSSADTADIHFVFACSPSGHTAVSRQ
jgi:hypothetical protein